MCAFAWLMGLHFCIHRLDMDVFRMEFDMLITKLGDDDDGDNDHLDAIHLKNFSIDGDNIRFYVDLKNFNHKNLCVIS